MKVAWHKLPFKNIFAWQAKSHIKSGDGEKTGRYKFFVCSDTEVKRLNEYLLNKEALIFGTGGKASIHYCNEPFSYSTDCVVACSISETVNLKFIYYFFRQKNLKILQEGFKGSGLQHISKKYIEALDIPLPPLPEQERIVKKIEELLSDLDASVAELRTAKEKLKLYRQAVLKQVFEGKLISGDVSYGELTDIVDEIRIGPFGTMLHKKDYIENGLPIINPKHVRQQRIIADPKVTITDKKSDELASYKLKENDIIMGRRGEMGRTAPVTSKEVGWICGTGSMIFRLKPQYSAFIYSMILSSQHSIHYLEENSTGTTMKNLNENIVKHIPVPLYSWEQQTVISQDIETRLSICENIDKTVDEALQQSEAMRHSILKKAFEGKLV